jgi:hypothetical protein
MAWSWRTTRTNARRPCGVEVAGRQVGVDRDSGEHAHCLDEETRSTRAVVRIRVVDAAAD